MVCRNRESDRSRPHLRHWVRIEGANRMGSLETSTSDPVDGTYVLRNCGYAPGELLSCWPINLDGKNIRLNAAVEFD